MGNPAGAALGGISGAAPDAVAHACLHRRPRGQVRRLEKSLDALLLQLARQVLLEHLTSSWPSAAGIDSCRSWGCGSRATLRTAAPGVRRSGSHHAAEAHPRPREGGVPPVGAARGPGSLRGSLGRATVLVA